MSCERLQQAVEDKNIEDFFLGGGAALLHWIHVLGNGTVRLHQICRRYSTLILSLAEYTGNSSALTKYAKLHQSFNTFPSCIFIKHVEWNCRLYALGWMKLCVLCATKVRVSPEYTWLPYIGISWQIWNQNHKYLKGNFQVYYYAMYC